MVYICNRSNGIPKEVWSSKPTSYDHLQILLEMNLYTLEVSIEISSIVSPRWAFLWAMIIKVK
jgi:hypothetical protein